MDELTIWVDQKHGELPVRDAIQVITDDWIDYGNYCNATVVDLRNACAALQAEVHALRAEVERLQLLLTKSRTLLLDAVMHGMPITDDVLEIRNWQPLPAPPNKEE